MSRTYKDKKWELRFPEDHWKFGTESVPYERDVTKCWRWYGPTDLIGHWLHDLPGVKTKKKKSDDTKWHWMSTPSWWTRTTFTRPERKATKALLHKALLQDIEEVDIPDCGRKPHIYYW